MAKGISIQLYTLREESKNGLRPTLERLAEIGFDAVEAAGFGDLTASEFRTCVEDLGMKVSGSHIGLPEPGQAEALLDSQDPLGPTSLIVAFLPPDNFKNADAVRKTAEQLNDFNTKVQARGSTLGYHNHWFEFSTLIDSSPAYYDLFSQLDQSIIAELDTYWAQTGGTSAVEAVSRLGERARLLHIKDGPADKHTSNMVAAGQGSMDITGIFGVSQADWHIVELDRCDTDMFTAVEQSHAYLREIS